MSKYFSLVTLFSLVLSSCKDSGMHDQGHSALKTLEYTDFTNHEIPEGQEFTLAKIKMIVNLESPKDIPPLQVNSIYTIDDRYIYIHSRETGQIYTFNHEGELMKILGRGLGKGPGEYLKPTQLVSSRDILYLNDNMGQKVMKYGIDSGDYEGEIKHNSSVYEIEVWQEEVFAYTPYLTSSSIFQVLNGKWKNLETMTRNPCYDEVDFYTGRKITRYEDTLYLLDYLAGHVFALESFNTELLQHRYTIILESQLLLSDCSSFNSALLNGGDLGVRLPVQFTETQDHFILDIMDLNLKKRKIIQSKNSDRWIVTSDLGEKYSFVNILPHFPAQKFSDDHFAAIVTNDYLLNIIGIPVDSLPPDLSRITDPDHLSFIIYDLVPF